MKLVYVKLIFLSITYKKILNRIEIPRVEDKNTPPVSLILDARTPNWKNLTELYRNDKYYVALYREKKTTVNAVSIYDYFTKTMTPPADCTEGKRQYNPICGRYSLWNGAGTYTSSCHLNTQCYKYDIHQGCYTKGLHLSYWPNDEQTCNDASGDWEYSFKWGSCWENVAGTTPEPYLNNGSHTYPAPWSGTISDLWTVTGHDCVLEHDSIGTVSALCDFQNLK